MTFEGNFVGTLLCCPSCPDGKESEASKPVRFSGVSLSMLCMGRVGALPLASSGMLPMGTALLGKLSMEACAAWKFPGMFCIGIPSIDAPAAGAGRVPNASLTMPGMLCCDAPRRGMPGMPPIPIMPVTAMVSMKVFSKAGPACANCAALNPCGGAGCPRELCGTAAL